MSSPIFDLGITKPERNGVFTIGWVGGFLWGHRESLFELVFPAIKLLPFECRLVLLGVTDTDDEIEIREYFKDHSHLSIEIPGDIEWNNEVELQKKIVQFDIGVATLSNEQVQLSKSGIKAKQYLNNGIPVICNDLPENSNVVEDGFNGFICNTPEEFARSFEEFKNMNAGEYADFSKNARQSVMRYTYPMYLKDFEKMLFT